MTETFQHRPAGGPFSDPCVYVRLLRERRAILFDLGAVHKLGQTEILKVTEVFLSHLHMDHFIGFDHLLRSLLSRGGPPLRIYGPSPLIRALGGRLRGYSWDLLDSYFLTIEAVEVEGGSMRRARFESQRGFEPELLGEEPFNGILHSEELFTARAVELVHGPRHPALGFLLKERRRLNVDTEELDRLGLPRGSWLSELKAAIREGKPDDFPLETGARKVELGAARRAVIESRGQRLGYVMDTAPTVDNIEKIVGLVSGADVLYMEAYFLDEDLERARERHHLTARLSGETARRAGVKRLIVTHFSPKYRKESETPREEALRAFGGD